MAEENTFVVHRRHSSCYPDISINVTAATLVQNGSVPENGDVLDHGTHILYCNGSRQRFTDDKLRAPARLHQHDYYANLHLHTNASGDFVIASKKAWAAIRGFPEDPAFYMATDSYGIFQLFAAGYDQAIFLQPHRIYHADHSRADRAGFNEPSYQEHEENFGLILRGEVSYCYNDLHWGLANYLLHFPQTPAPLKKATTMTSTQKQYDVIIIGNGSLGIGTAFELKKKDRQLKVALIGPPNRHHAASTTAGAMVNVWAEISNNQFNYPALLERFGLGLNAFSMWNGLCAELSEYASEEIKVNWGTYIINNPLGSPMEDRSVDYAIECMKRFSIPHKICNPNDIAWYKPEAKARATRMVHCPDGYFDPYKVLGAYDKAVETLGVDVFHDEAQALGLGANGDVHKVTLSGGDTVSGKNIVLANGTFAQNLIDPIPELRQNTPRLLWGGGSAIDLQFPEWVMRGGGLDNHIFEMDGVIRTVDRGGACGLHVVPHGNGRFYVGASSGVWLNPEWAPRVHAIHVLVRAIAEEISTAFFYATMALRGPGFRPVTMDAFPLLGESHVKGIWFANGTKRDGFTCMPFISQQMAKAMAGEVHQLPERFKPSRALISYKNKAAAVDDAVSAGYGGEVQHGLVLPPYAVQGYRQAKRAVIENIYEKRGITDFGIHPELTHIYEDDYQYAIAGHARESVG